MVKKIIPVSDIPHMAEQWDYEKNIDDIKSTQSNLKKPKHWKCKKCGYEWSASPVARLASTGQCPCCEQNKVIVKGINDLLTLNPEAAVSYDFEKNADIDIYKLGPGSHTSAHWKCHKCGYESYTSIKSRTGSSFKCACCDSNKVIRKGVNDVFTVVPGLINWYDFEGNPNIDIYSQGIDSRVPVHLKCNECGRKWTTMIKARIKKVNGKYEVVGCPHYNTVKRKSVDPISAIPELMRFWNFDKNALDPTLTPSNSTEVALWQCKNCEYEWQTTIIAQTKGTGKCLCCELYRVTKKGFTDLFTLIPEAINSYNFEKNKDIDIYNHSLRSKVLLWWKCPDCGREWQASIATRIEGKEGIYSLRQCQQCYIHSSERITPVSAIPKLVKFWDYKKNKELDINLTSAYLDEYAWWVCENCGYEWQSTIRSRTNASDGCPCCDSERAINKGFNDVLTLVPEIAYIYDFDKNTNIDIYSQGVNSKQKASFRCQACGYKWESIIGKRVTKDKVGTYRVVGCPVCDNKSHRKMSYAEQYPELALMYDDEQNEKSLASITSYESNTIKLWWKCKVCGNSFDSRVQSMIVALDTKSKGCPYCSNTKLIEGNSFADIHPELITEYDPNNIIDPYTVFTNAKVKVKWICQNNCEHKWLASFAQRHTGMGNCPICNRTKLVKGINTFVDEYPEYARLWSPNNSRTAEEIFYNSSLWLRWICPTCNEEYGAYIKDIISGEESCPYCSNRYVLAGLNSLLDIVPDIAKLWSPNNDRCANSVFPYTRTWAKWICPDCGGEYNALIKDMTSGEASCPYCDDRKVLPGFNSLADLHPSIANLWSPNNIRLPINVFSDSATPAKWICPDCGGEYNALIKDMTSGEASCPYCDDRKVLPGFNSFAAKHKDLLEEWDYVNNYLLANADYISDTCIIPVWWNCLKNSEHRYTMTPSRKLIYQKRHKEACPYCKGLRRKKRHFV